MTKNLDVLEKRRILVAFFIVSFVLTLSLSYVFIATNQVVFGTIKAQNQNGSQQVKKRIKYYNKLRFREAVQEWEIALGIYQENEQLLEQAAVRGNLAKAYQKLGDIEQTVKQWEQVVMLHRQLKNPSNLGTRERTCPLHTAV